MDIFAVTCLLNEKRLPIKGPDSFEHCILACKISNQMHTNSQKRKVPPAASSNFVQKWLFCNTYVLYNMYIFYLWPKLLKNTFEVVHTQYRPFSRKIYINMENLLNCQFYDSSFTLDILNRYFSDFLFVAGRQ